MDMFDPAFGIAEIGVVELHCVPQVVVTPVLPVLNHHVNGHSVGTVAVQHLGQFA